jgi:uncharacterized protein involved in exopolysaccharide biosynthesis
MPAPAPPDPAEPLSWTGIVRALRRSWWLLPPLLALGVAAAVYAHQDDQDLYRSEATLVFSPSAQVEEGFEVMDALRVLSDRSIQGTFAELLSSPAIRRSAAEAAELPESAADEYVVGAAIAQEANVVDVTVDGPDATTSQAFAEAALAEATSRFTGLYPTFVITTLESPSAPTEPLPSGLLQDLVLAGGAATMLWIAVALVRDRFSAISGGEGSRRKRHRDRSGTPSPPGTGPTGSRGSQMAARRSAWPDTRPSVAQPGAARS